jgi:hypothetical protein
MKTKIVLASFNFLELVGCAEENICNYSCYNFLCEKCKNAIYHGSITMDGKEYRFEFLGQKVDGITFFDSSFEKEVESVPKYVKEGVVKYCKKRLKELYEK